MIDTRPERTRETQTKTSHPVMQYMKLDHAFTYFNKRLFGGELPSCMLTLHRKARAGGYYAHERWNSRTESEEKTSEIALNPDFFEGETDKFILSILVHEMCHLWQATSDQPGRRGYHDKIWAAKMESLGLMPSNTGQPGGKRTGQRMTHYIMDGGAFDVAASELLAKGQKVDWQSYAIDETSRRKKNASKTKYTCPECGVNAWAKPDVQLACVECGVILVAE